MSFTTRIKDEISNTDTNPIEAISELAAFIRFNAVILNNTIEITLDNPNVARRVYSFIKNIFGVSIKTTLRDQKMFKLKKLYILTIKEKYRFILESLNIKQENRKILPNPYLLEGDEEKIAFLKGLFLACGSVNDPQNGTYHLEFLIGVKKEADYIKKILNEYSANAKVFKRKNQYIVYIKSAEVISDLLKMYGAINSMFYFEDIRIFRDHKNMVNRLNNCEIANQEKIITTGLKQLDEIKYITDNNLIELLDDKVKTIIEYRIKYPEVSYQELSNIINLETNYRISKSGINHAFIKIRNLISKHQD